jgi:hypothetical protein
MNSTRGPSIDNNKVSRAAESTKRFANLIRDHQKSITPSSYARHSPSGIHEPVIFVQLGTRFRRAATLGVEAPGRPARMTFSEPRMPLAAAFTRLRAPGSWPKLSPPVGARTPQVPHAVSVLPFDRFGGAGSRSRSLGTYEYGHVLPGSSVTRRREPRVMTRRAMPQASSGLCECRLRASEPCLEWCRCSPVANNDAVSNTHIGSGGVRNSAVSSFERARVSQSAWAQARQPRHPLWRIQCQLREPPGLAVSFITLRGRRRGDRLRELSRRGTTRHRQHDAARRAATQHEPR